MLITADNIEDIFNKQLVCRHTQQGFHMKVCGYLVYKFQNKYINVYLSESSGHQSTTGPFSVSFDAFCREWEVEAT